MALMSPLVGMNGVVCSSVYLQLVPDSLAELVLEPGRSNTHHSWRAHSSSPKLSLKYSFLQAYRRAGILVIAPYHQHSQHSSSWISETLSQMKIYQFWKPCVVGCPGPAGHTDNSYYLYPTLSKPL